MYTKSHEDRKMQRECAACDAAIRWGAEAETTLDELLLATERMLADAGRRLKTELELPPGSRYDLATTAARLSCEVETLRNRLAEDVADLARIGRERERHERRRCEDHAASLPEHLLDTADAMLRALTPQREEGR